MTTRKELIEALRPRYCSSVFADRVKILDEFVAVTGYHRKHAIQLLGSEVSSAKAAQARRGLAPVVFGQHRYAAGAKRRHIA